MKHKHVHLIDEEVTFPPSAELVSTTDTRGVITYANEEFCQVAGYRYEELVSHNHNIVRHPDMPSEAFKDMWAHLKARQPWRGAVKNRCKDGRYYWVDAFVTPIYEQGELAGYQSVRRQLRPDIRQRAETGYRKLLKGQRATPRYSPSVTQRQAAFALLSALLIALTTQLSPWYSLLFPVLVVVLFYAELLRHSVFNEKLGRTYDSISRYIYCHTPSHHAEFHLHIQEGKIETIIGRTLDSSRELLQKVTGMEKVSGETQQNIAI